ncbi:SMI1/KNR4 family protein [Lolliginicoccus suaedae]|uniref:SMI1/KNR4 family protein n=1 Tax=Lolliginicoccus suaedae TaxID=2605429 RepID=UPI001658E521|nr:SMI1/KNR4 family protein [Lolliginicoccus suaedae]
MSIEWNWQRVLTWCAHHAPVTASRIRPPADPQEVRDAETATGRPWPEQLRQWFALHDGSPQDRPVAQVLPGFIPCSASEAATTNAEMVEIWQENTDELGGAEALEAGQTSYTYLPAYIPIAHDGGRGYLLVDTRPGPLSGCVLEFTGEDADQFGPQWRSIDEMLGEIADALEHGGNVAEWTPRAGGGELDWEIE